MENDIRSGCNISDDDTDSSKMTCTSIEGSTTSGFAMKDSSSSRSSTREFPVQKWTLATPSSTGNTRQLEKHMHTLGKKKLKRTEKQRMSKFFKNLAKNDQQLSSYFSVSNPEKVSSSSKNERGKVKSMKQHKLDTSNKQQDQEPQSSTSKRMRLDARGYRQWLGSRARKAKAPGRALVPDLLLGTRSLLSRGDQNITRANASEEVEEGGDQNITRANASEEVEEGVVENCFSCPKRQRVEFDSKQQHCSRNAELGHDLHGTSVPRVVFEQASVARSPPQDEIAVSDIRDKIRAAKDDGMQSMPRLSMGLPEEYADDVNGKGSQLDAETNAQHNACVVCMLGGQLLFCVGEGCKNCYHISCLDPPLNNNPPGVWHCIWCVKKKIELGMHSVSQEVASIWDARELVSDSTVLQNEKQYLVKYRGLAHVHNRWISETELLLEAPKLVAKFNKKNKVTRWKAEWAVPHRLLQKRKIPFPKHYDGYHSDGDDGNTLNVHYEWLVKWTGLGYDHSTWELESASFLTSPEAMKLKKDFESRHEKTEQLSRISESDKEGKGTFSELSELSFGDSPGAYNRYLSYVNKLRKYWHKGQNAVVVDQLQERVVKVILFILSLQFVARRPFLIISTSTALCVWEDEFLHIAPSANVVVYKGTKDVRSSIRSLEFYNAGGRIMFQVLLSSSDAVLEDLEVLECIGWEAIIIDECQRSRMSRDLRKIKMLAADMRLLLFSSQIKDCSSHYHGLLSLLDSGHDGLNSDNTEVDSDTDIDKLRKQFARYIAFECKSVSSRFIEYWVPVQLSDLQLEQYCSTLLSNSMLLSSCLKNDQADDALRDIIFSTRKCCDHPYMLDQSLQSIVTKGLPIEDYLNVGIKVSGKLELLDKILSEMKSRDLRVLILFQSIGDSGRDSIGNILDDFVCQRFGKDSYVRIEGRGYVRSKKLAALNLFNDKASGRFVFLIEDRACLPSIKLSSVDTVILFDSDYDPQNDLKSLHRMTIGSQFERLKVFRLYSSCTIEEKVLILAKEGATLDGNIRTLNRNTCHTLLNWGASYLFHKLDDFHRCKKSASGSNISSDQSFLNEVFHELLTQLPSSGNIDPSNCSIISKVQQNGVYARNILLHGEKEMDLMDNEPPPFSWKNLLKGRYPQWKFLSESSPRDRRRVQYIDKSPKESEFVNDAVIKKSQKVINNRVAPVYLKSRLKDKRKLVPVDKDDKLADSKGDLNQSSQFLLKPEISQLCEILQLPGNVKATAVLFLEYIMKDYNVSWEDESTRQAFQISLCWTAAALLSYEINHKESFALAKLHLNFDCKEEEVDYIYSRLQNAKKVFSRCSENVEGVKESNNAKTSNFTTSGEQDSEWGEMPMGFQSHNVSDQAVPATTEESPGSRREEKNNICSSIRKVQEIFGKRMGKLLSKQQKKNNKFNRKMREEREKLEEAPKSESALICRRESDMSVRLDKLKILDHNFKEKMDEHNHQMAIHRKILEASQLASRIEEEQLKASIKPGVDIDPSQLEKSKSGTLVSSLGNLCSSDNELKVEKLRPGNTTGIVVDPQNAVPNAILSSPEQTESGTVQGVPSEVPDISLNEKTFFSLPMGTIPIPTESDTEGDGMEAIISERATATCGEQHNKAGSTSDSVEDGGPVSGPSERQSPAKNEQTIQSVVQPSEVPQTVPNEVIVRNDATQPNKDSGIDAVSLEREAVSKVGQLNRAATPICGESPTLEVPGTNSSMVQPDINNIQKDSFLSQQLPISINPSSTGHNLPAIPVSIGIQNHQSSLSHAPSQEAQVPTQPLIEVPEELFGHSVEHPITHLPSQPSTSMPTGGIETHVQDLPSTTTLLGVNDPVTPEMPQHACSDPLQNEMERINKDKEQAFKMHKDKILQLKYEYNKEIEEIRMKYEMLLQDAETALLQKKKDLDSYYKKVYVNKLLAEALTLKQDNYKADGSSAIVSSSLSQLIQQTTQISGPRHEQILASTTAASPLQISHLSAIPSTSPGPSGRPLSRPIIHSQDGSVLRAPAPHLQAPRRSASMLTPHVPTMCSGMPNELSNPPTPVMQTQLTSESYNICLPESGGFPVFYSSLSDHPRTNLQGQLRLHDFSSYSTPSQYGQAVTSASGFPMVSSDAATDVVCISDE